MRIEEIKRRVAPVLSHFQIQKAALFGSVARGEDRADSDVDVLIEMPRPYGILRFLEVKNELEDALARKVDLVEYAMLKEGIRDRALHDAIEII